MDEPRRKLLRRRDVPGTVRFLTFSCYQRLGLFDHDKIKDCFVSQLCKAVCEYEMSLLAWVVMPEHAHLVVYAEADNAIPRFLQMLKAPFARLVVNRWRELRAPILQRLTDRSGGIHFGKPAAVTIGTLSAMN